MELDAIGGRYMVVKNGPKNSGHQVVLRFGNGYGASIVQSPYSYGGSEGLFEIGVALFRGEGDEWDLNYDTPVTDDVIGWLSWEQVVETCEAIESLPPAQRTVSDGGEL